MAGAQPVGWRQVHRLACLHAGQPGEHVFKILAGVDSETPAVLYDGVEDGGFLSGLGTTDEEPVLRAELGRADPVLDEVVVDLHRKRSTEHLVHFCESSRGSRTYATALSSAVAGSPEK